MGLPGMVLSAVSAVAGAIMYWATTAQSYSVVQSHGFRLSTLGVILMIAGGIGFVISFIVFMVSRRTPPGPTHTVNREVVDSEGHRSLMHEEQR